MPTSEDVAASQQPRLPRIVLRIGGKIISLSQQRMNGSSSERGGGDGSGDGDLKRDSDGDLKRDSDDGDEDGERGGDGDLELDHNRDHNRDLKRDRNRNLGHDRDGECDGQHDHERDSQRDDERDSQRDPNRDLERDREPDHNGDRNGEGNGDGNRERDGDGDLECNRKRDFGHDGDGQRDGQRDNQRNGECDDQREHESAHNGDRDGDLDSENDGGGDLSQQIENAIKDSHHNFDEDDAPEWLLEAGETKSKDPSYQFCPAPHRGAVLRLFIQHFFLHPVFPTRLGVSVSASEIRKAAVKEMYMHCKRNGLTEVWGYVWTQWYSPTRWTLWARSTSKYLSRLRTTMTVENHWGQMKHDYLHFLHRPRLDQVIYLISTALIPDFMTHAHRLEDAYRLGRARKLTAFQKRFKKAWKTERKAAVSGRVYQTDVALW